MKSQINLDTTCRGADVTINGVLINPMLARRMTIVLEGGKPPTYTISNEEDVEWVNGMPCGGEIDET